MPPPRSTTFACRSSAAASCVASLPAQLTSAQFTSALNTSVLVAAALLATVLLAPPANAFFDEPAPKVDCSKKENRGKPQCKKSQLGPTFAPALATRTPRDRAPNEEVFFAAYGLARAGQYAAALAILKSADQSDPRVLNYQGFATRKLGDVDGALPFYRRALDIKPDYVLARAYMGEAYLQNGQIVEARGQLAEIERRCGRVCAEYVDLALQIDAYDNPSRETPTRGG